MLRGRLSRRMVGMTEQLTEVRDDLDVERSLMEIEQELARQDKRSRRFQGNVMFFGGMLVLISLASLVAVAAKLGTKDIHVTSTAAPAATQAAPATAPSTTPTATAPGALPSATTVALKEFKVLPSNSTVASGKVVFKVHNAGTVTHEFVVLKTNHPASKLPLYKGRADESGNVGETGDLKPGQSKNIALVLPPGHYALICNLPGHYLAGQHTDLIVK
jgi:uncharacterized cupredoxin-like copper-binding protein